MAARPPPALVDDVITEILLRLTPDDIACLARASLVCKPWRRLVSDRAFLRRYRDFHGAPPVLGFIYNDYPMAMGGCRPQFIRTAPASPFSGSVSSGGPTRCRILDCRHGRVLLHHHQDGYPLRLSVWDPVTGRQRFFCAPLHVEFTAAVLCASNGCDHLHCSSGSFLVVLVEKNYRGHRTPWRLDAEMAQASVYSSDTGKWVVSASVDVGHFFPRGTQSLLAAGTVFFMVGVGQILMYELARGILSVTMEPLPLVQNMNLCHAEDGGPGVAALEEGYSLRLMSLRTNPNGVTEWVRGKAIELDSMVTTDIGYLFPKFLVLGFAEGTSYVFISANDTIFSVELRSGRFNKILNNGKYGPIIFPFMGFIIPGTISRAHHSSF